MINEIRQFAKKNMMMRMGKHKIAVKKFESNY
jgi:hypothetical protein